jgi:GNAT superfamily N-acetyltransferase
MADAATVEQTLGAAFADDPFWAWLIGPDRANSRRCGKAILAIAMAHARHGISTMTHDGQSVAIWTPPGKSRVTLRQMAPHLVGAIAALGFGGLSRLGPTSAIDKMHPKEPNYYLAFLGTHPEHQGKGKGSAAMAPVLARADTEGIGCYLESSKEENLPLYERHGFVVTSVFDVDKGNGPRLWFMWRDPQPPT